MSSTPHENIRSEERGGVKVRKANPLVKFIGFLTLLLKPERRNNIIPLYAYKNLDEKLLKELLKLANKGRVLVAIIEFR